MTSESLSVAANGLQIKCLTSPSQEGRLCRGDPSLKRRLKTQLPCRERTKNSLFWSRTNYTSIFLCDHDFAAGGDRKRKIRDQNSPPREIPLMSMSKNHDNNICDDVVYATRGFMGVRVASILHVGPAGSENAAPPRVQANYCSKLMWS